jgi:hypothetical protein
VDIEDLEYLVGDGFGKGFGLGKRGRGGWSEGREIRKFGKNGRRGLKCGRFKIE